MSVCWFILSAEANGKGSAQSEEKKEMNMRGKASCHGSPSENWSLESKAVEEWECD